MRKILTNNYLLIIDLFLRIVLSILLPKAFDPVMLAKYNYVLVLFFWFMISDLGTSLGFSLRIIRKYKSDSVNFAYILYSFLFSFFLTGSIIIIYFLISTVSIINFPTFFITFFCLSFYSFLTTIFKGLGLFTIDSFGKIIVSLVLILLILFRNNLDTYYYILFPYSFGAVYLLYSFRLKINAFFKKTISLVNIGIYNIKTGFTLYLTNSLLIAFSLMDRVVFSGVILIENYGNYLFCYTLSGLHILTQNQITNKYYRLFLSENRSDNKKKINLIFISVLGHIILFVVILFIVNLNIFKSFYSKYKYLDKYIITTELICISISILSLLYLIINSSKVRMPFLLLSYFVPITMFVLYKLKLIDNFYNWIFVYTFELLIAVYLLFKRNFFYFYTNNNNADRVNW